MWQHQRGVRPRSWLALLTVTVVVAGCSAGAPTPSPFAVSASPSTRVRTAVGGPVGAATPATGATTPAAPATSSPVTPAPTPATAAAPEGLILVRQTVDVWNGTYLLVAADGSTVRTLGPGVAAAWTPDGTSIRLATLDKACVPHLSTVSVDGSRTVAVAAALCAGDYGFTWSPDGSQVAFVRYQHGMPPRSCGSQGGTYSAEELVADVIVMGADGQDQRVAVHTTWPVFLSWSPDGTRIAFTTSVPPPASGITAHEIVDVRTGALTTLDRIDGGPVSWSPDGRWLAFLATTGTATNIGLARPDRTGLRTLHGAEGRATGTLAWSADSSSIATYAYRGDAATFGVDGGPLLALDVATGAVRDPGVRDGNTSLPLAWSPDGRWIAYVPEGTDGSPPGPLTLVDVAGGERRSLAGTSAPSAWPEWFAWQPGRENVR